MIIQQQQQLLLLRVVRLLDIMVVIFCDFQKILGFGCEDCGCGMRVVEF